MLKGLHLWRWAWPMVPPPGNTMQPSPVLEESFPTIHPNFPPQPILANPVAESQIRIFRCDLEEPGKEIMAEVL